MSHTVGKKLLSRLRNPRNLHVHAISLPSFLKGQLLLSSNSANNPRNCSLYQDVSARRYFAGKKKNSKNAKRKKLKLSPSVYGTPKTGLILPNKKKLRDCEVDNSILGVTVGKSSDQRRINQQLDQSKTTAYSPLVDHGDQRKRNPHDDNFTQSLKLQDQSLGQKSVFGDLGEIAGDVQDFNSGAISHQKNNLGLNSILDITSMYDPKIHLPLKPDFSNPLNNYEVATPLGEELMKYIGVLGCPITVAEYMKRCLTDEKFGYYTNPPNSSFDGSTDDDDFDTDFSEDEKETEGRGHRLIGQAGDFTTAPEISQIFGECLTIWILTQYEALGKPSKIQLVELGPGRGTLMCDIIRSAISIKGPGEEFINALKKNWIGSGNEPKDGSKLNSINGIHFVEVSPNLRITQRESLQNLKTNLEGMKNSRELFNFMPWKSRDEKMKDMEDLVSKLRDKKAEGEDIDVDTLTELVAQKRQDGYQDLGNHGDVTESDSSQTGDGIISVHWHDSFDSVPFQKDVYGKIESIPTIIVGQEFLDALPVHVFQKTDDGWRERMVDVAMIDDDDSSKRIESNIYAKQNKVEVKMRDGTIAKTYSTPSINCADSKAKNVKKRPRFRHVLSPGVTPALRSLLHVDDNGEPLLNNSTNSVLNDAPKGTIMEVCPEALSLIQDISLRVDECKGAAIMIDYGNDGSRDTLRAFRKHEQVDVLSSPGNVDITADVDFGALRNAVNIDMKVTSGMIGEGLDSMKNEQKKDIPEAFGPQTQGQFLASMGAVERTVNLIQDDATTDDQAEDLCTALERLTSISEMGERFKVFAIARKKDGIFPPPGF